jgi:hypothetical protein
MRLEIIHQDRNTMKNISKAAVAALAILSSGLMVVQAMAEEKPKPFTIKGNEQQALSKAKSQPAPNSPMSNPAPRPGTGLKAAAATADRAKIQANAP